MIIRQGNRTVRSVHNTAWIGSRIVRTRASVVAKRRSPVPHKPAQTVPYQHEGAAQEPAATGTAPLSVQQVTSSSSLPSITAVNGDSAPSHRLPVIVPEDNSLLTLSKEPWAEALRELLAVPCLVVARQLEMMNVLIGYEQANKYQLLDENGTLRGYLVEEELGMGSILKRQMLGTHRPFRAMLLSPEGETLLVIRRPFSWINSRIYVATPSSSTSLSGGDQTAAVQAGEEIIGEAQQEWHLYRRRYNQFVRSAYSSSNSAPPRNTEGSVPSDDEMEQFGKIDAGLLAWDFVVEDETGRKIASINR